MVAIRAVEKQQTVEVLALLKALLSKSELTAHQGDVTDLPELLRRALVLCNFVCLLHSVQLKSKIKLVILIGSQVKGHRLLAVRLQKFGQLAKVALWNSLNQSLSLFRVSLENCILIVDDRQEKSVSINVEGLVDKVKA